MKHFENPLAICPFYKFEERSVIVCEGVQEDSNLRMSFGNPSDKRDYERALCCHDYKRCIWAKALLEKYEKGG